MRETTARDISRFATAPQPKRQAPVRVVKTNKKKVDNKRAFKRRCVAFVVVVLLLMVTTVFSRMQLTVVRSQINDCTAELANEQSYNTYLNYELESTISLEDAEAYAVNDLGLVKLNSNQIQYVNLNNENSIDVHETEPTFWDAVKAFFKDVVTFFGGDA